MGLVKQSYLEWLNRQEQGDRLDAYKTYDSYYNGDQDVDIPSKVRAALESELGTRLNYCRVVVDTPVDYMFGGGTGSQVSRCIDLQYHGELEQEKYLLDILNKNKMLDANVFKLATIMGKKGDVFLRLSVVDDEIKINVMRPEMVFPRYLTDDYEVMKYCIVKWFEESDVEEDEGTLNIVAYFPDRIEHYRLQAVDRDNTLWASQASEWELVSQEDNLLGVIPIVHIRNTIDDYEFGVSDLQAMIDLQDALNKTITDMLLTMDNQAFQRLILWGAQSPKGKQISMEPGIITEFANADGRMDIVPATTIEPFLGAIREIRDEILTVTNTSKLPVVEQEVSHPSSGFALQVKLIPLERKCSRKKISINNGLKELSQIIFKAQNLLGGPDYTDYAPEFLFMGGMPVDEQSKAQVNGIYLAGGIYSRPRVMRGVNVEDPDQEIKDIANDGWYQGTKQHQEFEERQIEKQQEFTEDMQEKQLDVAAEQLDEQLEIAQAKQEKANGRE